MIMPPSYDVAPTDSYVMYIYKQKNVPTFKINPSKLIVSNLRTTICGMSTVRQ